MFPGDLHVLVITLSDRAYKGEYDDLSGPAILQLVRDFFASRDLKIRTTYQIIPDDPDQLNRLLKIYLSSGVDVIFTTGGTGIGRKDFTPDVVKPWLDKEIPGIMEMIRVKYGMNMPAALLSRSIAGVAGNTLVYCLPGSVRAVQDYCQEILPTIRHSLKMILGIDDHS